MDELVNDFLNVKNEVVSVNITQCLEKRGIRGAIIDARRVARAEVQGLHGGHEGCNRRSHAGYILVRGGQCSDAAHREYAIHSLARCNVALKAAVDEVGNIHVQGLEAFIHDEV